ncbi:MAG: hypothetical protein ACHQ49_02105 [Elusimicrobiota bacterium]
MIRTALAAAAFALASPALAGAPAAAAAKAPAALSGAGCEPTGMISLSLIEALTALRQPELAGIFSFVAEKNAPFAFASLVARDKKAMKLYLNKLDGDFKTAAGLTEWDHEVCASLITLYSSQLSADPKILKRINDCMLAPTVSLEELVLRRKR